MPIVAYQGEQGAFSEQAARKIFDEKIRLKPLGSFREVFEFASGHRASLGVIPLENSVYGSVHENYDLLLKHSLFIVGEVKLRIRLHLMTLPKVALRDIRFIYSHPQALGQCETFLRSLNGVSVVAHYDTAGSAKMIREQQQYHATALASSQAARVYGLTSKVIITITLDLLFSQRSLQIQFPPARPRWFSR